VTKAYDQRFFDWVNLTARRSARRVLPVVIEHVKPRSVLDVGCGQGAWLAEWRELGVTDVMGVDGAYVAQDQLLVPLECFRPEDLSRHWRIDRRFDLVQSLEVAEHLHPGTSTGFVDSLCAHGDLVLFSAAQPGQGGEGHINERKLSDWTALFATRGYSAFDFVRPYINGNRDVDPWYRHNIIVFANGPGASRLSPLAQRCLIEDAARLDQGGDWAWKLRCALLRPWPPWLVTLLSRLRYRLIVTLTNARSMRP
jgi:hypothetical protein